MAKVEKGIVFTSNNVIDYAEGVISAGESFIIPSGAPHSVNAPERFKMIITMIRE